MKYLRKYNESSESDFDINFAMSKIKEHFPEDKVSSMYDGEILEWVDEDWKDDFDSEHDWYTDHNNGEAQDVVIGQIIDWFVMEYKIKLDMEDYSLLFETIKKEYTFLDYL